MATVGVKGLNIHPDDDADDDYMACTTETGQTDGRLLRPTSWWP